MNTMKKTRIKFVRACGVYGIGDFATVSDARARTLVKEKFAQLAPLDVEGGDVAKKTAAQEKRGEPSGGQTRQTTVGPQKR